MSPQLFCGNWTLLQFSGLFTQTVGLLGRVISTSQGLYLHTGKHKQNKRTQTSMPQVGFEPTIPASERAKTVHALDRSLTVIGNEVDLA
jgi:FAD synthase